jgi:branched-chain amino acid transport system ATP-binding protein
MRISDKVVVMDHGKMVATGSPEEIRRNQEVIDIYLGKKSENKDSQESQVEVLSPAESKRQGQPLVEVKNLDLFYGSAQALFSVSVKFYPQQITSILGTNGSGKSTLLKAISGAEKPSFGEIFFNGIPLPVGVPEIINEYGIQFVPQGHMIFHELTVIENLKIGGYALEKKGGKLSQGLEKVFNYFPDLRDFRTLQAANLSGGQQQMLAMAQALIGNPSLLLLDEPSLGLSPTLVDKLFDIILKISKEEKCSIAIVEQNTQKALEVSDYIFMMSSGVLIAEGTSEQLSRNNNVIKELLGFR